MADEINTPTDGVENEAPEEKTSGKETAWVELLRYHKSFTAKLLLSDTAVRDYYAEIVTELLSYERVRSRTGWSGVTFSVGRTQLARCTINGKTLCLYLAADPEELSGGRYKARDAAATRKYEKTPALFRVRSAGSARNAVARIADVAAAMGLVKKDPLPEPITAKAFPQDSFQNLLTRGLIRLMRGKTVADLEPAAGEPEGEPAGVPLSAPTGEVPSMDVYTDTVESVRGAISRHAEYGSICEALDAGDASVKLSQKKMLRAIDEDWVRRVEDSLLALDELIRSPSHYIAETEEILPMELTKKITGRSVVHLCQHTDYIASVNGDEITPSKLLNVFREDSVLTYENKFLNTLLAHLYYFVTTRYRIALEQGADEQVSEVQFENNFFDGENRGKIRVSIELCEKLTDPEGVRKGFLGSGLWKRVERLNGVVKTYMESDFVRQMGRNYVKPPILRTNAILKNKYMRQCLDLWNFLEGYDETGVGLTVGETVSEPSVDYLCELSENAAAQYLLFCHHTKGISEEEALASYQTPQLHPDVRVRDDADEPEEADFDVLTDAPETEGERDILFAVRVALEAAELYVPPVEEPETESAEEEAEAEAETGETGSGAFRGLLFEKDFQAKIRLADEKCRAYFVEIANAMLALRRVKMRISRSCCTFTAGRTKLAKITVRGKTLCFYTALARESLPAGFFARDVSLVKKYEATPTLLRVRGPRGLKNALAAVERLAEQFELPAATRPLTVSAEEFAPMTVAEMMERGWIRRVGTPAPAEPGDTGEEPETPAESDIAGEEPEPGVPEEEESAAQTEAVREHLDDLKPFEYNYRREDTPPKDERVADYFEHSPADPENYDLPEDLPAAETLAGKTGEEHLLPDILYPGEMDYSRPTGKGVDDSSGFLQDSRETTEGTSPEKSGKRSLFDRLFGKKNGKNNK